MWPVGLPSVLLVGRQAHGFVQPESHRAFLRVTEGQFAIGGVDRDFEVQQALAGGPVVNAQRPFIGANHRAVLGHPLVARLDHARIFPGSDLDKAVMNDLPEVFVFAPEVQAIDRAMRKPHGTVMFVIVIFAGHVLHRPVAGHRQIVRAEHRITKRAGHILEMILGEELAVDVHAQSVGQLDDLDPGARCGSGSFFGGDGSPRSGQ